MRVIEPKEHLVCPRYILADARRSVREIGREGGREMGRGREGGQKGRREGGREGGRDGGREGGEGRGGREGGGREGGKARCVACNIHIWANLCSLHDMCAYVSNKIENS